MSVPNSQTTSVLGAFLDMLAVWRPAFRQQRTFLRAIRLALAHVCHTRTAHDQSLACLWTRTTRLVGGLQVAGDLTHVRKTGKKVTGVHCMRDPMSPPFHVNLIFERAKGAFHFSRLGQRPRNFVKTEESGLKARFIMPQSLDN